MSFTLDPTGSYCCCYMLSGGNFKRNNTVDTSEVCFISVFEVAALTIIIHKLVILRASMCGQQQQCRHVRSCS